ncbi:MAG: ribonuclease III [Phycisphaerales bacterium]
MPARRTRRARNVRPHPPGIGVRGVFARRDHGREYMSSAHIETAQSILGHQFADPTLLTRALTHASVAGSRQESNERMEFLGDSVLALVCCELIYSLYPDLLEGEMTKIKSTVVSRQTCATIARDLGLHKLLFLGKGMQTHRELPSSLAAAAVESVIAAIYLDAGIEPVRKFLRPLLEPMIHRAATSGHQENFKSVLQQHAQLTFGESPVYQVLDEKGPDHAKCFEIAVEIGGRRFPACWGQSKKQAEQQAAQLALSELGLLDQTDDGRKVMKPAPANGNATASRKAAAPAAVETTTR